MKKMFKLLLIVALFTCILPNNYVIAEATIGLSIEESKPSNFYTNEDIDCCSKVTYIKGIIRLTWVQNRHKNNPPQGRE